MIWLLLVLIVIAAVFLIVYLSNQKKDDSFPVPTYSHVPASFDDGRYHVSLPDCEWPKSFVAFDFETATPSRMACQIGIVEVKDGEIINEKSYLIQPPGNKYYQSCIAVHGIHPIDTANAPAFNALWPEISQLLENHLLVAHNITFDLDVLKVNLAYYGIPYVPPTQQLCTCKLLGGANLLSAAMHFGICLDDQHNALSDAKTCAELLLSIANCPEKRFDILKMGIEDNFSRNVEKDSSRFSASKLSPDVKRQDLESCVNSDTIFYDKKIVITGVFDNYPIRETLAQLLKSYGANINTSISRKTDIVIAGHGAGPAKMDQVDLINSSGEGHIRIIHESELMRILSAAK